MSNQQKIDFKKTLLYKHFSEEKEEILKHKWLESEKAGQDIGFNKALLDWIVYHRKNWKKSKKRL
jgi:hypothetical protein